MAAELAQPRVLLTLAEAVTWLDPPLSLRALQLLVAGARLEVRGTRRARGRPAALYDASELARLHADWVDRRISTRRPAEEPHGVAS